MAYEALLKECVPHVRRVVRRAGVAADRADDVIQDVLLTIHRARQTYDPARSFKAWLTAIAHRRAIDDLRYRGRLARREVFDDVSYDAAQDDSVTPEDAWQAAGRSEEMQEAVATLPPSQREAVETLAVRQLSLNEAAVETGKSKGSLKVNLHRALKALRIRFGDDG